jgi:murein L,D-transpeptidase YcbB/YkuD
VTGRRWILGVSLVFAGACAHSKTTDKGGEKETAKQEQKKDEKDEKEAKPRAARETTKQSPELHPGKPDAVPVATAPEALLKPGAEEKIRERLVAGGFVDDGDKKSAAAAREGIRRFQKEHDLPATGVADHETVKALGLDPDQIFRQATVKD